MKLGVMGLGHMGEGMAWTAQHLPETELWACAAQDWGRAIRFAGRFGFQRAYGTYEELYRDPEVELIYIATPNSFHYEQARAALLCGKHVLCEKPLTVRAREAEELVKLAQEQHRFLMEAQMLRFMPLTGTLQALLREGVIGEPLSFTANLLYPLRDKARVMTPELGGGALLDIGVYPLTMTDLIAGHRWTRVLSDAVLTETGVDGTDHILLRYDSGFTASLTISMEGSFYRDGVLNGTDGYLILRDVNHFTRIEQYDRNGRWRHSWEKPEQLSDYAHELSAAVRAIETGQLQCGEYPWETMLVLLRLMDSLRKQWGVTGV